MWNCIDYVTALRMQRELWERTACASETKLLSFVSASNDLTLLPFVPPPVWTVGRALRQENILNLYPALSSVQSQLLPVDRGGHVTYHGPGQLVFFPVPSPSRKDSPRAQGPRWWVCTLEDVVLRTARSLGVVLQRREGFPGLWDARGKKVVSVGIRLTQTAVLHGISVNLDKRVASGFSLIDPCGLKDVSPGTLSELCGDEVTEEKFLLALGKSMHAPELPQAHVMRAKADLRTGTSIRLEP